MGAKCPKLETGLTLALTFKLKGTPKKCILGPHLSSPRLIHHIDDTSTARAVIEKLLRAALPDIEVMGFNSLEAYQAHLAADATLPWLILTDWKMAGGTGIDLLEWIKRKAWFHHTPAVLVSAEVGDEDRIEAKRAGAFAFLSKPVDPAELAEMLKQREAVTMSDEEWRKLDREFARSTHRALEKILSENPQTLSGEGYRDALHALHTAKAEAASLSYPTLSKFAHLAESAFLAAGAAPSPAVTGLLRGSLTYLHAQSIRIQSSEDLERPSLVMVDALNAVALGGRDNPRPQHLSSHGTAEAVPDSPSALELSIHRFETLQNSLKDVLLSTVQLNTLVVQLGQAYRAKEAGVELLGEKLTAVEHKVKKLSDLERNLLEVMVAVFIIQGGRLRSYAESVVATTTHQTGKKVLFGVDIPPGLEIDQAVFETLKFVLTHLIRNAIDHGIEPEERRANLHKSRVGNLKLRVEARRRFQILLVLEDDGAGIDPSALRQKLLKQGLMKAEDIATKSDEDILDAIFLDGFSTREVANEISGRGIGLGAVKKIVTAKGGYIRVKSVVGAGTTFEVMVPRVLQLMA